MTDTPLLSEHEIVDLCCGLTQPARQLAFLHERGFARAYLFRGRVCLERAHYDAVCRGQFGHAPASADNDRPRLKSHAQAHA